MNYQAHYDRLIARAVERVLIVYSERHHVVPRCLGGGDDKSNIVRLTAEEHYVAHQLLVKLHPGHHGLLFAASAMTLDGKAKRPRNKLYGWLRRLSSIAFSGDRHPMFGTHPSSETLAKLSAARRGRRHSAETLAKMSGQKRSEETCNKIRVSLLGHTTSKETRAKIGNAHRGKKLSKLQLEIMRKSHLGVKASKETREKMSASRSAYWKARKQVKEQRLFP